MSVSIESVSSVASSPARPRSRCALPKIVVTGVRSSCETRPRNSSLTMFEAASASAAARSASSALRRSVTSTMTLTAPTSLSRLSWSGVGYAMKTARVPSSRSSSASTPRMARSSFSAIAIGHSS